MIDNQSNSLDANEDSDFDFSRIQYLDLIQKNNQAIDALLEIATETESGRLYEVLGNLIRTSADITDKIGNLHKQKRDIKKTKELAANSTTQTANTTTNNNNTIAFIGSTSDLQNLLAGINTKEEKLVDAIVQPDTINLIEEDSNGF